MNAKKVRKSVLNRVTNPVSSITSAAVIVAAFSVLSRFVGFIRDRILAGTFGVGDDLDVYFAAFKIPDALFQFIVIGAISASFIPLFTKHYAKNKERAWFFTNNTLHVVTALFGLFILVGIVFAGPLSTLVAPGFDPVKQAYVADLSRVMFAAQLLLAISMVFGSVLQGLRRFVVYSMAPILYNVGIIIGILGFVPYVGIQGASYGVLLGAFLHLGIQFLGVKSAGYVYKPIFKLHNEDMKYMAKHMLPRVLGLTVNQINFVGMTIIASTLAVGSVTVLQFAYNLYFFPVGVVGVSFAIAAFPALCETAHKKEAFVQTFSSSVKQILLFAVPATILFIALRAQIVRVVLGAGAFDWTATVVTAQTLMFFAVSIVMQSLIFLLVRAFFALEDTLTPFLIGLVSAALNVVLALLLVGDHGVTSLGFSYSVAATLQAIVLWILLRAKVGSLRESSVAKAFMTFLLASAVCAAVTQKAKILIGTNVELDTFLAVITQAVVAGSLGLAAYLLVTYHLRNEETLQFFEGLKKRLLKRAKPEEPAVTDLGT